MKRSASVPLTLVTTLSAGALAACGGRAEPLQCVDRATQRVVPDSVCARAGVSRDAAAPATGASTGTATATHGGGFPLGGVFAWYYGGRVVRGLVSGGSYAPLEGRSYRSSSGFVTGRGGTRGPVFRSAPSARSGVSRGGFGATGAGRFGGS